MSTAKQRSGLTRRKSFSYYSQKFIDKGWEIITVEDEFGGTANDYLIMKCSKGHVSKKRPRVCNDKTGRGYGCTKCNNVTKHNQYGYNEDQINKKVAHKHVKVVYSTFTNTNTPCQWECLRCGYDKIINTASNISHVGGGCSSCSGSIGENVILNWLEKQTDLTYIFQYMSKPDINDPDTWCKNKKCLKYDFMVKSKEGIVMYIEFDGAQHFNPIDHWGGRKTFKKVRKHDVIKSYHCWDNSIPLLRIHHEELNNIPLILKEFIDEHRDSYTTHPLIYTNHDDYDDLHNAVVGEILKNNPNMSLDL